MCSVIKIETPEEQLYNESQIRSRNPIERVFGFWERRFPALTVGFRLKLQKIFPIIVATAVLHNTLWQRGEDLPLDDPQMDLPAPWVQLGV
ncbi:hypothetical protein ANN_03935 [Periplaneta americana]|uniref:DDE Tnp4 domain-containing protein n=1 Tax=Periplaneta americana TaxID=6978 RepID=A0ABQ8T771_PERAM|nr:hypothetical protein ANN_03935 [Periplaneta americana]